jgi:hypothetical protein
MVWSIPSDEPPRENNTTPALVFDKHTRKVFIDVFLIEKFVMTFDLRLIFLIILNTSSFLFLLLE